MRTVLAILSCVTSVAALTACDTSPTVPARVSLVAVCAVAETSTFKVAAEAWLADEVIEDPVGDPPPPPPPGEVPLACCVSESGAPVTCVPMDYDQDDCVAVADRPEATVLTDYVEGTYTGTEIPNAYFGCEGGNEGGGGGCEEGDGAYILQVQGAVAVIEFIDPEDPTAIRIYDIGEAAVVRTLDGGPLHAVLDPSHGFSDPSKPVIRNGVFIGNANVQTDWLPNGCGHTGNIC